MDLTSIILIIIAFIAGCLLTFMLKKDKNTENLSGKIATLEAEKNDITQRLSYQIDESSKKMAELKKEYETLLEAANAECKRLDDDLKNTTSGNIDDVLKEKLNEIDKLKKKVKSLEEELEENEDDIDDLKKKIRTKDADISELQISLSKEEKNAKQLHEELERLQQNLNDKTEELNLKIGSLEFIQEILSAKEITTEDTKQLYKNIDYLESFIKGRYTELNLLLYDNYKNLSWNNVKGKNGFEIKRKFFYDGFDQWASTKRKSWLDGKITIAFVGEFSAGKTSIVNRILSQDNPDIPQLPVSTKATTAIPTYIAGGSTISYSFISGDGKRKTILEDTFKKVSKDILDQIKGVSSLIKYFVMTYKNPNLTGLSILDTPGFNSNDKEDKERTIDVINECDALFWVFDVNAGTVNRSSIEIIKEKLNKPLYVVINKIDTKSESDIKKVEDLIKKTLTDEGLKVQQFIRFSSKSPLDNIMKPIKGVSKIKTRDTFVSDVREDIEQLLNVFNENIKLLNKSYNNALNEGNKITDEFIERMKSMQNDCGIAYNIPHWETHIFSKDRYEMSESEGKHLQNLLEKIADNHIQALANKFDERVDKTEEIQQKWTDLCNMKAAWQKINECYESYKKIVQNI